jgi:hypothetical protein
VKAGLTQLLFLADAKYQTLEGISGHTDPWTRILAYISEFTPPMLRAQDKGLPVVVFYVGEDDKVLPGNAKGIDVVLFPLRPNTASSTAVAFESKLSALIGKP